MRDRAAVFEAAGYSLFGPLALNVAAPDEGNMHMLEAIATVASVSGICGRSLRVRSGRASR
jgi:hypothetical protein